MSARALILLMTLFGMSRKLTNFGALLCSISQLCLVLSPVRHSTMTVTRPSTSRSMASTRSSASSQEPAGGWKAGLALLVEPVAVAGPSVSVSVLVRLRPRLPVARPSSAAAATDAGAGDSSVSTLRFPRPPRPPLAGVGVLVLAVAAAVPVLARLPGAERPFFWKTGLPFMDL